MDVTLVHMGCRLWWIGHWYVNVMNTAGFRVKLPHIMGRIAGGTCSGAGLVELKGSSGEELVAPMACNVCAKCVDP